MRNLSQFLLVIFIIFFCLAGWVLYGHANCGLPGHPADAPGSGEELKEPSQPSSPQLPPTSPDTGTSKPSSSTGPSGPKVYQENKKGWTDALPKLPGYGGAPQGTPSEPSSPGGNVTTPPKAPMVKKGLMDKIRSTPRAPAEEEPKKPSEEPKNPEPTVPATCGECFLITEDRIFPRYLMMDDSTNSQMRISYERETSNKAIRMCRESGNKDCPFAKECDIPRDVTTEYSQDLYGDNDGNVSVDGVKTKVGIHIRCVPKPPESPFGPFTSGIEGEITIPWEPPASGSSEGGGFSGPDAPKTPDSPKTPDVPKDSDVSKIPETPLPPKVSVGSPVPDEPKIPASEKPSKCEECFKVVVELPFSNSPFNDFESQWQEAAFNKAKGICQETYSDKECTSSIPCGDKPVEREDIYPENLSFDPTSGRVSEGIKTRIGIYYKCIALTGERPKAPPETPKVPETPEQPETPKVPETPKTPPETPRGDISETPKDPHITETPKEPYIIETPKDPHITETPKDPHITETPKKPFTKDTPKESDTPKEVDKPKTPKEKPKGWIVDKPKVPPIVDKPKKVIVDKPKEKDKPPPKETDDPPPKEEEECTCEYLNHEWIPWQTIEGKYVFLPDTKQDYKIPIEGHKRRVELKAAGRDEDILIVRSIKRVEGEERCRGSRNIHSPDLLVYNWQILEGPGNFHNGQRDDQGEAVIYIPPDNLALGEHRVIIKTEIEDEGKKGPDEKRSGTIRMLVKKKENDADHYYIDFEVVPFPAVDTPQEPPPQACDCVITTRWEEGGAVAHNIVKPDDGFMMCTEKVDTWIGQGPDDDILQIICTDPECGTDIEPLTIEDPLTHMWSAQHGNYLDGNTGKKVLYKSPPEVPRGPIPNELIMMDSQDSGEQYADRKPDTVKKRIIIAEIDLVIHKPPVIDPAESEIPEEEEFKKGSQTFVNMDNDDDGARFDTGTTDVSIAGEDEMVKLILRLKPKDLDRGNVRLEAATGAEYIKVWKEANKTTEYVLGSPLVVPNDFRVEGDFLITNLYVEGIKHHTDQRQTQLRMVYSEIPDCPDEVALTIIGIEKIEWIGKNNSLNDDNTLTADTNFPAGLGVKAWRVFPDARLIGGAIEVSPRDKVDVKATLTVKPIEAVKIYFDSFDVDDPSIDHPPVDDETVPEDNREPVLALKAGQFTAEAGGILEQDFDDQEETFEFQVTHQPGDNFRVVGNGDRDFLSDLENNDNLWAGNDDKLRITNKFIGGATAVDKEIREPAHYASDVLTVWRFLHVEVDSMGAVTGNEVSGEIVDMTPKDSAIANKLFVNNNLDDGSKNLSDVPIPPIPKEYGRFENGILTIPTRLGTLNIQGNGADFVQGAAVLNMVPVSFSAIDNDWFGNSTMLGTITHITHNGTHWVLMLNITNANPAVVDWPDFVGGTISAAGGSNVGIVATSAVTSSVEVRELHIPYTLKDDDTLIGDVPDPDVTGIAVTYAPVYIVPLFDTGKNTPAAPFVVNSHGVGQRFQIEANRGAPKSEHRCWVVSALGAYQMSQDIYAPLAGAVGLAQHERAGDNDPDSEGTDRARAWRITHGLIMGEESIRDWIATPALQGPGGVDPAGGGRQTRRQEILNHEIGHLFGLNHPDGFIGPFDPQGGVMAPSCCPPDNPAQKTRGISTFTERSQDIIRDRLRPGIPYP